MTLANYGDSVRKSPSCGGRMRSSRPHRRFRPGGARPSTQVKLLYIRAYRHRFGVEPICAVLSAHDMKIAPQTYYGWLAHPVRPAELAEAYLVNDIVNLYRRNKYVYG